MILLLCYSISYFSKLFFFFIPGGPYAAFAGTDATRGLATGTVAGSDKEYDDVSDLTPDEVSAAKEWEEQFTGTSFTTSFH